MEGKKDGGQGCDKEMTIIRAVIFSFARGFSQSSDTQLNVPLPKF